MKEESETIEFKVSTSELPVAINSIVAMLNKHKKGTLYFGIKNNGTPIGQQFGENTLRDVTRTITENIESKIYPVVEKILLDGKECIKVSFEGEDIPYFAYGRTYMRVGDEDRKLSQREIKRIILNNEEKLNRWEDKISDISLEDVSEDTIMKFIKRG